MFSLVLFSSLGKQPIVMHFIFLKKSKTKQSESENSQTKISPGQPDQSKSDLLAVAIWPVTGQGFENTKWPAVRYFQ